MNDIKKRILSAVNNFNEKQLETEKTESRQYTQREKPVVIELLKYLNSNGFHAFRVEASQYWTKDGADELAPVGCSDILGTCPNGRALYLEVKAPYNKTGLKDHQREFLEKTIDLGGIGVCSYSVEHFAGIYKTWLLTPDGDKINYLKSCLPQKGKSSSGSKSMSDLDSALS